MKKLIILLLSTYCSLSLFAQNVTVVFSQNKCYFQFEEENTKLWKEQLAPILNDLVKQEKLIDWGVLTHAWGDEWNWNVYYVAENQNKFNDAFGEFFERVLENNPDVMKEFGKFCFEHKDSIYTEIMGYNEEENTEGN